MRNIYIIARKKKVHLKISQKSKKIPVPEFLFSKVESFIKKETLAQVLSCEFCKIFKNTFFYRTPVGDYFCT